jgi:hypothetical protein
LGVRPTPTPHHLLPTTQSLFPNPQYLPHFPLPISYHLIPKPLAWGISSLVSPPPFWTIFAESESAPVAWVALPRGRGDAAPPYFSHLTGAAS